MTKKKRAEQDARIICRIKKARKVERRTLFNDLLFYAVPSTLFSNMCLHGNTTWAPEQLAAQALIWSWQDTMRVTDAFEKTLEICKELGLEKIAKTYTSFMDAISKHRETLSCGLRSRLQTLAEKIGGKFFRTKGWVLLGFDGSRASAPRSIDNEKAFSAPNYGEGKKAKYNKNKRAKLKDNEVAFVKAERAAPPEPQSWITMIWHMSLRLPWTWRLGPSNSSERKHVQEMLEQEEFPEDTLFCGDAGFVGYPLWNAILKAQGHFLVRVGANVSLLSETVDYQEADGGIVLCWPKDRMQSGDPPLRLRLVKVQVGKTKMWMLTSVLNKKDLTDKQIIEYYKMRWLIEVEFRGLKQTIDKHTLRCRNAKRLLAELEWSLLAMAFAELIALRSQIDAAEKEDASYTPRERSLANTLRVLRRYMRNLNEVTRPDALTQDLIDAVVQRYKNTTDKRARCRPKNADVKPLGDPMIRQMTLQERRKAKIITQEIAA